MAIPILNHLDFRYTAEAQNLIVHKTTEASATNTEGALIYDTGTDTIKYRNASAWVSLTAATSVTVSDNSGSTAMPVVFNDESNNLHDDTGTFTYKPSTGTVTATTFVGALTGNVTGNASGTALTVTQAAQTAITSLGTLTALTVDDIALNGKVMTMTGSSGDTATMTVGTNGTLDITTVDTAAAAANIQITADGTAELAGTTVTLDSSGGITLDADGGTVTFADAGSSLGTITSSGWTGDVVGDVTGDVTGNADTATKIASITNSNIVQLTSSQTLTNKTLTSPVLNTGVSGTAIKDEDDMTSNSATHLATQQSIKAYVDATTAGSVTVSDSTANTNFPVVFHDESNTLHDDTGALRYNPSTGTLLVPNLSVAGTTTTVDTVTMEASNAIIFEGATADSNETTLSIVDPTGDHTQYLINQGGYIPVLAAATTTAITSTPAELNTLDGFNGDVTDLNYAKTLYDTGVTGTEFNYLDGVTSAIQTQIDSKSPTTGHSSIATVGTIGTGTWEGTDVAVAHGGTGASTLTDGGILVGSGTGAVTAMAVLADGEMIVGDGTTDPVAESGATLRTSIGVGYASGAGVLAGTSQTTVVTPHKLAGRYKVAAIDVSDSDFTSNLYAEITHDLGSADVVVQVYDTTTEETVLCCVERKDKSGSASTSKITCRFAAAPANDLRVLIMGVHGGAEALTPAYA